MTTSKVPGKRPGNLKPHVPRITVRCPLHLAVGWGFRVYDPVERRLFEETLSLPECLRMAPPNYSV